jgi:hypothetical protein
MASIDDLNHISPQWWEVLKPWWDGRPVTRAELLSALNDDAPVPNEAKPFLASVASGEYQFRRGGIPHWGTKRIETHWHTQMLVDSFTDLIEGVIRGEEQVAEDYPPKKRAIIDRAVQDARDRVKGRFTPHQAAIELVAMHYEVSADLVEKWLQQWRDTIKRNRSGLRKVKKA